MKKKDRILKIYAAKYIWWKVPEEALRQPDRVVAQVMELGDYEDIQTLSEQFGDQYLKTVLLHAQAGIFSPKSWAYWHYRLGLSQPNQVPPLPKRRLS
jgi:hypothetical protein